MSIHDTEDVVTLHLAAFQGFFLSFLGKGFLRELYNSIITDTSGIALLIERNDKILGFVAGSDSPQGFYKRLLRQHWLQFAWASILPMINNPTIIPRLIRAFSHSKREDVRDNCATLMSIAVAPEFQCQGVGKLLIDVFLEEAKKRGVGQVNLTTDKLNNDAVNAFYLRLGFRLHSNFVTPEGREMNEYIIDL